jgi:hypothetical protein
MASLPQTRSLLKKKSNAKTKDTDLSKEELSDMESSLPQTRSLLKKLVEFGYLTLVPYTFQKEVQSKKNKKYMISVDAIRYEMTSYSKDSYYPIHDIFILNSNKIEKRGRPKAIIDSFVLPVSTKRRIVSSGSSSGASNLSSIGSSGSSSGGSYGASNKYIETNSSGGSSTYSPSTAGNSNLSDHSTVLGPNKETFSTSQISKLEAWFHPLRQNPITVMDIPISVPTCLGLNDGKLTSNNYIILLFSFLFCMQLVQFIHCILIVHPLFNHYIKICRNI